MYRSIPKLLIAVSISVFALTTACDQSAESESSEEQTEETEETQQDETVELTFAFQPQENPEGMQLDTEQFAEYMSNQTGYDVEVFLPTSYSAVVEALRSENADVAYFSGLPYLMAHQKADAELLVVEERDGDPYYHSKWYTRADNDVEELEQLEGESIAFTSPTSTSGYLFPMAELIDQNLVEKNGAAEDFFGEIRFAGGYEQALRALLNDQVVAAAASDYALEQYLSEEEQQQIETITRQGPVPTHGLAIRGGVDDEVKEEVRAALLQLNDEEHSDLLKSVYGAESLVERSHDEHVQALDHAYEVVDFESDI